MLLSWYALTRLRFTSLGSAARSTSESCAIWQPLNLNCKRLVREQIQDGSFPLANLPARVSFCSFNGGREMDSRSSTALISKPKRRRKLILEIDDDKSAVRLASMPDSSRHLICPRCAKDLTIF
jgi:hypothetical protein